MADKKNTGSKRKRSNGSKGAAKRAMAKKKRKPPVKHRGISYHA